MKCWDKVSAVVLVMLMTGCGGGGEVESGITTTEVVVDTTAEDTIVVSVEENDAEDPTDPLNSPPFPFVSFSPTTSITPGEEIELDGGGSSDDGEIVSYQWTQLSGSVPLVFSNPNEAVTTFIAPIVTEDETFDIELRVEDDDGLSGTTSVGIDINSVVSCGDCTDEQIITLSETESITVGRAGQVTAIEGSVLAVSNQASNSIEFLNLASGSIENEIQLNSAPDQLFFQENRRLLYISLLGTTTIAQLNVDTDEVRTFQTSGMVQSMTGSDDFVFYTVDSFPRFDVYSIGPNGDEQLHGDVNGSLIAYNANLNEIIDADADSTGGSLNRSGFNASGQLEFIQTADQDTGGFFGPVSFAENISISASGQQMAIAGGAGSSVSDTVNNGFQILDISPANVQVINGVWLADGQPVWVEFSPTDEHLITTGMIFGLGTSVTVFDAMSRTRLFEVEDSSCDIGFFDPIQTGFSKDNQYIYRTVQCDTSSQNPSTIISFTKFPEF